MLFLAKLFTRDECAHLSIRHKVRYYEFCHNKISIALESKAQLFLFVK